MTASSWAVRDSGFSEATIFYVFMIKQILTRVMKSFLSVILNRLQELHFDEMHMKSKEPCGCEYPGCIDLSKFFQRPYE